VKKISRKENYGSLVMKDFSFNRNSFRNYLYIYNYFLFVICKTLLTYKLLNADLLFSQNAINCIYRVFISYSLLGISYRLLSRERQCRSTMQIMQT